MGKKSRRKKERREGREKELKEVPRKRKGEGGWFFLEIIRFGTYFVLFTPLVLSGKFYFPFVGPKSLYFMAGVEIVFFSWLFLVIYYREYRPKLTAISLALILFLIALILSSVLGIDFSRSFWSKYERMTGLLMWLHLFAFFLAISSIFKRKSDWQKIFIVSISVASLISLAALFERAGLEAFKFSDRGGSTLGNTSFLGTYLLFNTFLALYLFFRPFGFKRSSRGNWGLRIYVLVALLLAVPAMYFNGARAASLSTFGGMGLLALLWLALQSKHKINRILGKILLAIFSLTVLAILILAFLPGSFVQQKFVALTTQARVVNWEMAWKGFLEKPFFGWGPENYTITFTKFFNPCLFTPECGREIWFDRTHNIVLDTLVTTGISGFLTYLGLFGAAFYVLGKKYFKEKNIDFWTFSIFLTLLIAYFIQNLTVFDMVTSLMMFILILGFGAFLANIGKEGEREREFVSKKRWLGVLLLFVFSITFFKFIIQPFRKDALVIKALRSQDSQTRVEIYKKASEASPLGKYQIREFFAQHSQDIIRRNIEKIPQEEAKKELDFVASQLEKSRKESPLDFRTVFKLAQLYDVYGLFDPQKLSLAEKYAKESIQLSPTNQQGYWVLAQTKIYQGDFETAISLAQEAIDLEPKWFQSHKIAVQVAQFSGDKEKAKEFAKKAIEINPAWQSEFKEILEEEG